MTISYKMSYMNLSFWLLAIFHNRQFTNDHWGIYHRFSSSTLSFVIKTKPRVKNLVLSCLWLYNFFQNNWWCNKNEFRLQLVAMIGRHPTLKRTFFVTNNLLWHSQKHTFKGKYCKSMINRSYAMENPSFGFLLFSMTNISKMASGGHLSPNSHLHPI